MKSEKPYDPLLFYTKTHVWEKSGSRDKGQKGEIWAGQLGELGPK